jgi:hypothetical protein
MTDGERLLDKNVLVHAYVRLDEKKQVTASGIVLPIWETGGGITTLQNLCEFFAVATKKVARPMPIGQAENIVREILSSTKWRVLDRREERLCTRWSWCARDARLFGMRSSPRACWRTGSRSS